MLSKGNKEEDTRQFRAEQYGREGASSYEQVQVQAIARQVNTERHIKVTIAKAF